eukprot:1194138-Prymnesium_polylepis.1
MSESRATIAKKSQHYPETNARQWETWEQSWLLGKEEDTSALMVSRKKGPKAKSMTRALTRNLHMRV